MNSLRIIKGYQATLNHSWLISADKSCYTHTWSIIQLSRLTSKTVLKPNLRKLETDLGQANRNLCMDMIQNVTKVHWSTHSNPHYGQLTKGLSGYKDGLDWASKQHTLTEPKQNNVLNLDSSVQFMVNQFTNDLMAMISPWSILYLDRARSNWLNQSDTWRFTSLLTWNRMVWSHDQFCPS